MREKEKGAEEKRTEGREGRNVARKVGGDVEENMSEKKGYSKEGEEGKVEGLKWKGAWWW